MAKLDLIPNKTARRIFLDRHDLIRPPLGHDTSDVLQTLGFVQFDSINTVARAHDLIMWSRMQKYRPQHLRDFADKERGAFEAWTHDASLISMAYYPHWKQKFRQDKDRLERRWSSDRRGDFLTLTQTVLDQIGENGPVCSGDVGAGEKRGSGGWWDWHPSKTALEYLWRTGRIAVCHRDGIRKYYDLAENVIPKPLIDTDYSPEETWDWACETALQKLGFATAKELSEFFDLVPLQFARDWVEAGQKSGLLRPISVQGTDKSETARVCLAAAWPHMLAPPSAAKRTRILSPFDPALRNRKRALELFGFDYKIEVFVPAAKRTYGYYVFPILEGQRLLGRIDIKAFRADNTLAIQGFWPQPVEKMSPARAVRLHAEIKRIATFSRCENIRGWEYLQTT